MSDIRPAIWLNSYERLAVRTLTEEDPVESSKLVESPGDWDLLAFSATGRGQGIVLLGKRPTGKTKVVNVRI